MIHVLPSPGKLWNDHRPQENFCVISGPRTNFSEPRTNFSEPRLNSSQPRLNFSEPRLNSSQPRANFKWFFRPSKLALKMVITSDHVYTHACFPRPVWMATGATFGVR